MTILIPRSTLLGTYWWLEARQRIPWWPIGMLWLTWWGLALAVVVGGVFVFPRSLP